MEYIYSKPTVVDLDILESAILISSFADTYQYLEWNGGCYDENKPKCRPDCIQPCTGKLEVHLSRELTTEEKIELDNIVNN